MIVNKIAKISKFSNSYTVTYVHCCYICFHTIVLNINIVYNELNLMKDKNRSLKPNCASLAKDKYARLMIEIDNNTIL